MATTVNDPPLTAEEVQAFLDGGFLRLPGVLAAAELDAVRSDMDELMRTAAPREDFRFAAGHRDGSQVLVRIDYVVDKSPAARAMLAHPLVLAATEQLAGRDFFPTQDAMVLKMPGQGIAVPWHRDRASTDDYPAEVPVFIADYYLDDADEDTCLWAVAGSHRWPDGHTREALQRMNDGGFSTTGATAVLMRAGDVLLHNVRLLHGSPPNESDKLRRVLYYTMHTAHVEWGLRSAHSRVHRRQTEGAAGVYSGASGRALRGDRTGVPLPPAGGVGQGTAGAR